MQSSRLVRILAAAASITLVTFALLGASWYAGDTNDRGALMVGVPTGEYVNGVQVQRLPSITVTARRGDIAAE